MPINPKEAPEGFYASAPPEDDLIPTCNGCWFYEDNPNGERCGDCVGGERVDMCDVIFLQIESD